MSNVNQGSVQSSKLKAKAKVSKSSKSYYILRRCTLSTSSPSISSLESQTNIACIPATTTPTANPTNPLAPPSTAGSAPLVEFDEEDELPEFELTLAAELVEFEYGKDVFVFVSAYIFVAGIFEQFPIGLIYKVHKKRNNSAPPSIPFYARR